MNLMKKLSLYIFLVLMVCNTVQALPECEGDDSNQWTNCKGTYIFEGAGKYVGEWKDGELHGHGILTYTSGEWTGDKYVGQFANGTFHGKGTYTNAERKNSEEEGMMIKYTGDYVEGKRHGNAIAWYADGTIHEGEYKNDMREGKGTLSRPGKWIFEGTFTTQTSWSGILKSLTDGRRFKVRVIDGVMTEQLPLEKKAKGIEKKND